MREKSCGIVVANSKRRDHFREAGSGVRIIQALKWILVGVLDSTG
jgi:hypothetical protein